mmetsp:Transcript_77688/g.196197  ORF Transcript_77688/g.196197 Transcript_77688/m.196197 type:complete len:86 (+) Transcript_77688:360-617(+)
MVSTSITITSRTCSAIAAPTSGAMQARTSPSKAITTIEHGTAEHWLAPSHKRQVERLHRGGASATVAAGIDLSRVVGQRRGTAIG